MIKRIIAFSLFGMLVVSLFLYLGGVRVGDITDYGINTFLKSITQKYNSWSFKIPSIPKVPELKKPEGKVKEIITALIWIVNLLVAIVNFVIMLVNFFIMFFNTLISIIQFILTLVISVKDWLKLFGISGSVSLT